MGSFGLLSFLLCTQCGSVALTLRAPLLIILCAFGNWQSNRTTQTLPHRCPTVTLRRLSGETASLTCRQALQRSANELIFKYKLFVLSRNGEQLLWSTLMRDKFCDVQGGTVKRKGLKTNVDMKKRSCRLQTNQRCCHFCDTSAKVFPNQIPEVGKIL